MQAPGRPEDDASPGVTWHKRMVRVCAESAGAEDEELLY